ncbi:MAG TPA: pseudaminic acid synthase [Kofleriaceae bacterium]|jgi:N-acetylneuraminate synthase
MTAKSPKSIDIGGTLVGPNQPPFIVAELSANHLGSLERAHAILDAAADIGCDALKLQTFTPASMTLDVREGAFAIADGPWQGRTLWDLYAEAHTPWEWHAELFAHGTARGLHMFSTPFDEESVERLDKLGAQIFKIASFELVDLELIAAAASTGKPLIMSTGMASEAEIAEAVDTARSHGAGGIVLMHCVSGYPTPPEQTNLRRLDALIPFCDVLGISDHSAGSTVPIAAVSRGACMVEKHLTLKRSDGGPDAGFSLEPNEFAEVVRGCKTAWAALGDGTSARPKAEAGSRQFRRSLYAAADIAAGEPLTRSNIRSIRPGHGLPPRELPSLLGRIARTTITRGTPLAWELIA